MPKIACSPPADALADDLAKVAPEQRFWRLYLLSGPAGFVWWALAILIIAGSILAASVTRFAPGAPLPDSRLTRVVVPDPTSGQPLSLSTGELAAFRAAHPAARLAPPPTAGDVALPEALPRQRQSLRVSYAATALPDGAIEMTVRASRPFSDSPGSFAYQTWRYHVVGDRLEAKVMLEFDPFMSWFFAAFAGLFVQALLGAAAEYWLLKRPMARERWRHAPPFNRDWLVTRGIPLRFECSNPATSTLDALAAALRAAGARVKHTPDPGALRASFGHMATLTANLRAGQQSAPPAIHLVIDGGLTPLATLLLVTVAPLSALVAVGTVGFWLLDPFSSIADRAARVFIASLLAAFAAALAIAVLRRDNLTGQADRLGETALAALSRAGARAVAATRWPRLTPPRSKWRRRLVWLLLGVAILGSVQLCVRPHLY